MFVFVLCGGENFVIELGLGGGYYLVEVCYWFFSGLIISVCRVLFWYGVLWDW